MTTTKKTTAKASAAAVKSPAKTVKSAKPAASNAAKPAKTAKAPAEKVKLTITVVPPEGYDGTEVYICGAAKTLGAWDAAKAVKVAGKDGEFSKTLTLKKGETAEFKLLAYPNWQSVEKGIWYEEIANHVITAEKDTAVTIEVHHFNTVI